MYGIEGQKQKAILALFLLEGCSVLAMKLLSLDGVPAHASPCGGPSLRPCRERWGAFTKSMDQSYRASKRVLDPADCQIQLDDDKPCVLPARLACDFVIGRMNVNSSSDLACVVCRLHEGVW